jgi:serine/threonine protein kinase
MTLAKATLKNGSPVDFLPEMIGEGTMKQVYFTQDRKSVVCFYKDAAAATDLGRLQRLELILTKYNPTLPRDQGGAGLNETEAGYFQHLYCWPTGIVVQPRFGFVAPAYPSNFIFHSGPDFLKGKEKNGMRFIRPKNRALLEKFLPEELGTWINYFKLCIQMARAVARLHTAGLAHSDLSPNNVLIDPSGGSSIIIDIDSLVVEGRFPPDVAGTKGYIAPEVLSTLQLPFRDPQRKHPNARTDLHALAVLIYQYLLRRHPLDGRKVPAANSAEEQELLSYGSQALFCEHPTDASNRPEEKSYVSCAALGPLLHDLFQRTFVKGLHKPNERPSALEWLRGLIKTWDLLVPCAAASCPSKWFVLHDLNQPRCPFCQTKLPAGVPVLKFRAERRPGQWMLDGQLVAYHNNSLFLWHAFDNVFPGPETDRTPQAYCALQQGQWLLVNQHLTSLTSPGGNRVPPGKAVVLTDGAQIRLSQEPHGRIADVQIVRV